ncbi:PDZ domain-containing protein [Flavobacteriaceae bacterium Ap0902]|nr:PDZ domain-containing protein [Flavobacteriaceae bacterium Ap0902]
MKSLYTFLNFFGAILAILLVFAIGFRAGQKYDIAVDENNDYVPISYSINEQKMRRLMSLIDNHYVDQVNTDSLIDNTIQYIMSNLDPHSVYLDQKVSKQMDQKMRGYYIGIGMEYVIFHDTLFVTRVNTNSPNSNLLQLGDRIIKVNDSIVTGAETENAHKLIQGEPNTFVKLSILRNHKNIEIKAQRAIIPDGTITDSYMLNDSLGYIKLKRFGEHSYTEFKSSLRNLKSKGMKVLVFDLRGNSGGLMSVAEKITDEFLTNNQLIVFTKDAKEKKKRYYATNKGDFDGEPLYVLIDEESASASEIVAGAIQDNDAGTIVGRRSFGKGLVQREISLGDGTKLRLTTARYYTPSGRSIQKPYINGKGKDYMKDITNRYLRGEMFFLDSIKVPDSLKYKTAKGRTVYGGGGIIPDVFVPLDSIQYSVWYYTYRDKKHFDEKIVNYIDQNKLKFKNIKEEDYIAFFNPKPLAEELISEIEGREIHWRPEEEEYFEALIKATIANYVYGDQVSQKIWIKQDPMLKRITALEKEKQ